MRIATPARHQSVKVFCGVSEDLKEHPSEEIVWFRFYSQIRLISPNYKAKVYHRYFHNVIWSLFE